MRIFSLRPETPFLGKFDAKNQNCQSNLKFSYPDQFEYGEFISDVHFFCFRPEISFLGKFVSKSKKQNYQFELKFGKYTNLNMQNSTVVFTFSIFVRKYLFWGKIGPKNKNYQFELQFGTWTNSNMLNSMMIQNFLFSTKNTLFGQIWSKKPTLSV